MIYQEKYVKSFQIFLNFFFPKSKKYFFRKIQFFLRRTSFNKGIPLFFDYIDIRHRPKKNFQKYFVLGWKPVFKCEDDVGWIDMMFPDVLVCSEPF